MIEDLREPDPERIRAAQVAFLKFLAEIVADDLLRRGSTEPRIGDRSEHPHPGEDG